MSKEKQIEGLESYIMIEASIECTRCKKSQEIIEDEPEYEAYENGWRVTDKHCYCPDCAKKYFKKRINLNQR